VAAVRSKDTRSSGNLLAAAPPKLLPIPSTVELWAVEDTRNGSVPDNVVRLDFATGSTLKTATLGRGRATALAYVPPADALLVMQGEDGSGLQRVDYRSGTVAEMGKPKAGILGLTWDRKRLLLWGSKGQSLFVIDYRSGEVLRDIPVTIPDPGESEAIGALSYDSWDDLIVFTTFNPRNNHQKLYAIRPSAEASNLSATPFAELPDSLYGLAFGSHDGDLYGFRYSTQQLVKIPFRKLLGMDRAMLPRTDLQPIGSTGSAMIPGLTFVVQ